MASYLGQNSTFRWLCFIVLQKCGHANSGMYAIILMLSLEHLASCDLGALKKIVDLQSKYLNVIVFVFASLEIK
jgi:hypothetical protein